VKSTLPRAFALAPARRSRLMLVAALGALTVAFGVGLMATAGYLISRAAERPAVLSLMVAIVAVRFFGMARPIVRYLERLVSHDIALGVLGRVRTRFYEGIEPLAPAQLGTYRAGDLLSRMVADVDALQNLHLRGLQPPLVALLAGALSVGAAVVFQPIAGAVLAGGLLVGGLAIPALGRCIAARTARRQAAGRGRLCSELIELIDTAPEIAAYGGERAALARVSDADRALVAIERRDALSAGATDGVGVLITGATVCGVLAVAIAASAAGKLDFVLIAALALLAMAGGKRARAVVHARRGPTDPRAHRPGVGRARPGGSAAASQLAVRGRARARPRALPASASSGDRRRLPAP
jgi:ABC-type transport system involved in cytochrome bd biosynthesis fused ATPase/permease subunit